MRLTPANGPHCSGPAWSSDGKTIAFASLWAAGNGLFLVPTEGGPPVKLYDKEGACEPHWSPDGKTIVYETETHIAAIGADGQKNRLVTTFGGVQRYGRFSPDGRSIVFCQGAGERGPWELYMVPAAGGKPVRITEEGSDMTPDWRP
jgi:Tol biopolymer transport system component